VIDRLRKNQNPLEKRNNLRSSLPHLVVGRRPENRATILRSEIHGHREPWLFRSLVFGSGIRRLDGEAVDGRRLARTSPRRVTLAGGFENCTTWLQRSLQPGMTPIPITLF
jgi:hypothetical protein